MPNQQLQLDEIGRLTSLLLEGGLSAADSCRLESALLSDPAAMDYYHRYLEIHSLLYWQHCPDADRPADESDTDGYLLGDCERRAAAEALPDLAWGEVDADICCGLSAIDSTPVASATGRGWSWGGLATQTGPFSCLVSALVLCVVAVIAWQWKPTDCRGLSEGLPLAATGDAARNSKAVYVGRITGMVDCRWSPTEAVPSRLDYVSVGQRFQLLAGLMEITYESGAKVILEGPAVYEVCANGGLLRAGKLAGKLERKPTGAVKAGAEGAGDIPNPSVFAIRTPTAVVTDLGTEFGVEVDKTGGVTSHVFRGSIEICPMGGLADRRELVLKENESARVAVGDDNAAAVQRIAISPERFVRQMQNRQAGAKASRPAARTPHDTSSDELQRRFQADGPK